MSDNLKNNPFAQLFSSLDAAETYSQRCENESQKSPIDVEAKSESGAELIIPQQHASVNDRIEKLFAISLDKNSKNYVVYLEEVALDCKQSWIDLNMLENALFERLLLSEPEHHVLNPEKRTLSTAGFVTEGKVITYLFRCYRNIFNVLDYQKNFENDSLKKMVSLVLRNMATALKQDELYEGQYMCPQLLEILTDAENVEFLSENKFLYRLTEELAKDEEDASKVVFDAYSLLFEKMGHDINRLTLSDYSRAGFFGVLQSFAENELTANAMLDISMPQHLKTGDSYQYTLLGSIFGISCLPRAGTSTTYLFFKKNDVYSQTEAVVWQALEDLQNKLHRLLFQLLRVSERVRAKTLTWIRNCLKANADRGKLLHMYTIDALPTDTRNCASDAFMLNMSCVLLRLAEPIISDKSIQKLLKIDPTYGTAPEFEKETCLIPCENPEERLKAVSYSFVTKIFFLSHQAMILGFRSCTERLIEMNQSLSRLYSTMQDVEGSGTTNEALQERMEYETTQFLSLKAALMVPKYQDLLFDLNVATSKWLVQVQLDSEPVPRQNYLLPKFKQLTFPLPETVPATFACIPEFFLENLNGFLSFCQAFNGDKLEERGVEGLEPFVTCILVLTRGNKRVKNPHLRAGLAESLQALLPSADAKITFSRTQVFKEHPHHREIVPCLLDVFVSIEMTGESVQDSKFKYRRAIYAVMELLWTMDVHKECFRKLAAEAEANMEAVNPPLFLRFLNLLINDAVYLLDEVLSKMAEIKNMQMARDAGEWQRLSSQENGQMQANYRHTGLLARYDNILSTCTIHTLEFLTEEIKTIFSHPMMVDRMTAMLNYFLNNLVGPNSQNLRVKDPKEFHFDPAVIVLSICRIYANLSDSDAFCLAISQDGRSYSKDLFIHAEKVLCKIDGSWLVAPLQQVAERVAQMAQKHKNQEELLADAPDDFLDPIMSTIMTDPVILPTSHVTVDRTTIARHLLSDQTDPFNRSPLTMEMVTPDDELKQKITSWMLERRQGTSKSADETTELH